MSESEIEREIARIDAGGSAWDDSDEIVHVEFKSFFVAFPVRLPSDAYRALKEEAQKAGVSTRELAGIWLTERLGEGRMKREQG